jgi:endonuclease/exonuclease/phosphatase family metal-dependent hydrolase/DNA/RNA endonuclease YhcR with UshA esterase domain
MRKSYSLFFTIVAFLLSVSSVYAQSPIPINEARQQSLGSTVTVTGHITVSDEFEGPVYFQDETGGIAWFDFGLMRDSGFTLDVNRGDSIVITGELGEFNDLIQIVGDAEYEFFPEGNKNVEPKSITVEELNSGDYEGQLVSMEVDVIHSGAFQSDEYTITDRTGSGVLYINDDTEVIGAAAPEGITTIVGVVGIFRGTYQLLPRDFNDIDAKEVVYPGEDVSKDDTFEIATWNIEWFGSTSNGPDNEEEQMENVARVIAEVDADVYAFQEISNTSSFADLIASMEGYGGFIADYSQSQRTAFLFKRATVDSLDSGQITTGLTQSNWANGRYPLFFRFNVTINEESREIYAYNIQAKAFDDPGSYSQRENASGELKLYLDNERAEANVIFLGDYNDTIEGSITDGEDSPYDNFDEDEEYTILTKALEEQGFQSQASGSFIDHITITSELLDEHIVEAQRVENTAYIGSYLSSTSDHYPIWTRFQFTTLVGNEKESNTQPTGYSLEQNYPNPFNPTTNIQYSLAENSVVTLRVYDMLGREIATLVNGERLNTGSYTATFNASDLSSGMYIYQLSTAEGVQLTRKMMLIK